MVVPPDRIEVFINARALNDLHSPVIEQAILTEFIAERHLARHIRRMRGTYEERQRILISEAKKHLIFSKITRFSIFKIIKHKRKHFIVNPSFQAPKLVAMVAVILFKLVRNF